MQALPALLFIAQQMRPGAPLELLAADGAYTRSSAMASIMSRAGFDVELIEGGFRYQSQRHPSTRTGLYGVRVATPEGVVFVGDGGEVGEDAAITARLQAWFGKQASSMSWSEVHLSAGSVAAEDHLVWEHAKSETPTQRQLPALVAQGLAMLEARMLQEQSAPANHPRSTPRL